jgi:hypothetical protein
MARRGLWKEEREGGEGRERERVGERVCRDKGEVSVFHDGLEAV